MVQKLSYLSQYLGTLVGIKLSNPDIQKCVKSPPAFRSISSNKGTSCGSNDNELKTDGKCLAMSRG